MKPTFFTRNRKLPFHKLVVFMLNLVKKSLQVELTVFMKLVSRIEGFEKSIDVSNSAFNQNRMKISPDFFNQLNKKLIEEYYTDNDENVNLWKGFRLLGGDSSLINLPITDELKNKYGVYTNQHTTELVIARISILYDLLNNLALDGQLASQCTGERDLALRHLKICEENDLIIYDRGYPSFDFVYEHTSLNLNFVMRCKHGFNNSIQSFVKSDSQSIVIDLAPGKNTPIKGKLYSRNDTIKVRLLKVILSSGEIEVLMTSLINQKNYPDSVFKELYYKRWGIETYYDILKNLIQVEKFTGYSAIAIEQDFYCALFISNLQSIIRNELNREALEKYKERQYEYKINNNIAFGLMKNEVVRLFLEEEPEMILRELKQTLIKHVVPVRPDRKNPRNKDKYRTRNSPVVPKNFIAAI